MGKVKVDPGLCVGCQTCVNQFEDLFEFNDQENIARVKDGADYQKLGLKKEDIESVCPAGAISVE